MRSDIVPGAVLPDYELSDHSAKRRKPIVVVSAFISIFFVQHELLPDKLSWLSYLQTINQIGQLD